MENKWTPGWLLQWMCVVLAFWMILGPARSSASSSSFIAAAMVIAVMRTLHKEKP